MSSNSAAGERAHHAVMAREVPDRSTNQGAFDAASRLRRRAGADYE